MPGLDAAESMGEADEDAVKDPSYTQVDSEVRFRHKRHGIKLEESPRTPYDDPENYHAQSPTGSEGHSEANTAGSDKNEAADVRSWESQGAAKSEAQTMVESMATSVMQLT